MAVLVTVAICPLVSSSCKYVVHLFLIPTLGSAQQVVRHSLGFLRIKVGKVTDTCPEMGRLVGQKPLPGTSPCQQPQFSLHLAHPSDRSPVPWCDMTSLANAGPWEKPRHPRRSTFAHPQPSPSTPASEGRHCFKSSINADNCCIKLQFIIFSGCRYVDDMRPRCIYIQIEDFY